MISISYHSNLYITLKKKNNFYITTPYNCNMNLNLIDMIQVKPSNDFLSISSEYVCTTRQNKD